MILLGERRALVVICQSSWPQELLGPSVCSTLHVAPPIFHRNWDGKGDRGAGGAGSRCGKNPGSWKWVDQYRRNLLEKNEFWWNEPCSWFPPSTNFDQVVRASRQRCRFYPNVFQVEVSSNAEACCCIPAGQLRSENGGSLHVFTFCFPKVAHRSATEFAPIFSTLVEDILMLDELQAIEGSCQGRIHIMHTFTSRGSWFPDTILAWGSTGGATIWTPILLSASRCAVWIVESNQLYP